MPNTKSRQKVTSVARKDVEAMIEQAVVRTIQLQREQVLSALTSSDKDKTKALQTIDALRVEVAENLHKVVIDVQDRQNTCKKDLHQVVVDVQDRQNACKKDCSDAIVKSSPNYLAIIGLAITLASPFIAWVAKIHYEIQEIQVKLASEDANSQRIQDIEKWFLDRQNTSSGIASQTPHVKLTTTSGN